MYPVSHDYPQYSMLLSAWYSLSPGTVQTLVVCGLRLTVAVDGGVVWSEVNGLIGVGWGVYASLQAVQCS